MKNVRIRAGEAEISASLKGNWRSERLFALKQALAAFDFCVTQFARCDVEIDALVAAIVKVAKPGGHLLCMSNGGFGGIHGKLLDALAAQA